jgi:tRNA dimethylallyltransferase
LNRASPRPENQDPAPAGRVPVPLLILAGPTAVGKSALAMAVAREAPGEIVAADCMQVYRGLDIGTGKPSRQDRAGVPHHLVDICDPSERFSAHEFTQRAQQAVDAIAARGRLPILVGGTGLYLRAFLKGRLAGPGADPALRSRLMQEAREQGAGALFGRLRAADPASAARIHPADLVRIVRALEIAEITGRRPSEVRLALWDAPRRANTLMVVLSRQREELSALIDARCRRMWETGLLDEVRALLARGLGAEARPLQAIGYRQAVAVLLGRLAEGEGLAAMQRATRQYAKRQLTWYRREPAAEWVSVQGWAWIEPLARELVERLARMASPAAAPLGERR